MRYNLQIIKDNPFLILRGDSEAFVNTDAQREAASLMFSSLCVIVIQNRLMIADCFIIHVKLRPVNTLFFLLELFWEFMKF